MPGIQTAQQELTQPLIVVPISASPLIFVAYKKIKIWIMFLYLWKAKCGLDDSDENYTENFEISHV